MFNYLLLVLVGILWGTTNPLIKLGSKGIESIKYDGQIKQIFMEFKYLLCRWQVIIENCIIINVINVSFNFSTLSHSYWTKVAA